MANELTVANVALVGNPNTGKSTIFNALTGIRQSIGNFPGVTVSRKSGSFKVEEKSFNLIDFPGCYSLAAHSAEELVILESLLGDNKHPQPDAIVCVVNADNLERGLFLLSQIMELSLPTILAINMTDVALSHGKKINYAKLSDLLGVRVIELQANKLRGLDELRQSVADCFATESDSNSPVLIFDRQIEQVISSVSSIVETGHSRFVATRLLFDIRDLFAKRFISGLNADQISMLEMSRQSVAHASESKQRHKWVQSICEQVETIEERKPSYTDRLDWLLTHRLLGLIVAVLAFVLSFQLVFWVAQPASQLIDTFNLFFANIIDDLLAEGPLNSLLKDGIISGVGGVLVFLPQILLVFLILGVLEDCGYLARAAFLMDRYLSKFGLSGVTTFPLLSSFACAIPGIMATRIINNERERLVTILIAPLMSCSARLPVYVLLIAAFVPEKSLFGVLQLQGIVMFAMYSIGIIAAIVVSWLLKKTLLRYESATFVLELPKYKIPSIRNIAHRMFNGGWAFVRDAGTMIVAVTIVVWALAYFPRMEVDSDSGLTKAQIASRQLEQSYLGRMGKFVEPAVKPLGWDWRIGSAAIASFPAREVVVSTFGVIFGLGSDVDEENESLRDSLKLATRPESGKPLFTLPVALSVMVFFALCAQCVSTLAVIKRETNSYKWPIFTFLYMTTLAYIGAWMMYNISSFFFHSFSQ